MDGPILRHLLATLAYRAAKVLRDAPPEFAQLNVSASTRRPVQIVAHMGDLMAWALTFAGGDYKWTAGGGDDWNTEVGRFLVASPPNVRVRDEPAAASPLL